MRYLCSSAGLLALAAALAQPACARQDAASSPVAVQDTAAAVWQRRVEAARARVTQAPADLNARRELVDLLLLLGKAREAETVAAGTDALALELGRALYAQGRLSDAAAAYGRAIDASPRVAVVARAELAAVLHRTGNEPAAAAQLERVAAWYAAATSPAIPELTAAGNALRLLGEREPQRFHDAVRAYEEAARMAPDAIEPRLAEAELFLEKYNSTDAQALLREVLARQPLQPDALLLLAKAKKFDGSDEALALVRRVLAMAPEHAAARLYHAELLLGLEEYDAAAQEAERVLAANPASLEGIALFATARYLAGDDAALDAGARRAAAINPRYPGVYTTAATLAGQQRRYPDAVVLAGKAVALDSSDWQAWTQLGMNQFRLGDVPRASTSLERAFAGDPFNAWVKNTLDLLDTYPQYVERKSARSTFFLHGDEADLLSLYALPLAEAAIDSLSRRYGYQPRGPIHVEVFPRHADFSVRTVGLTGLGALGVAFGEQLVLDSPAARERGDFNWGATLWHEIAHTFTLGLSRNRVPRWLTEGLSVYEERRARSGWGDELNPAFLAAYAGGRLRPVSRLNEGFVRPQFPEEVVFSYYLASLVVEYIEAQRGFGAVRGMLVAYGQGRSTAQVIRGALGVSPEQLDPQFDAWLRKRYARQLAAVQAQGEAPGAYATGVAQARAQIERGELAQAQRTLEQAKASFPEYAGAGSPYHLLAQLHERAGRKAQAAAELEQAALLQGDDYDALVHAAELRLALGDTARAAASLERTLYVHPYDPAVHGQLAELYARLGRTGDVVRERRAVVALKPVDMAAARYQLALALERAGDRAGARAEVLRALEIAPNYAAAQELLLRLTGGAP